MAFIQVEVRRATAEVQNSDQTELAMQISAQVKDDIEMALESGNFGNLNVTMVGEPTVIIPAGQIHSMIHLL